jgi:hypothetical protein
MPPLKLAAAKAVPLQKITGKKGQNIFEKKIILTLFCSF